MTISIILVEDNFNHVRYLNRYLSKDKFDSICFTNVDEADMYLSNNPHPDIALIDYDLDNGSLGTELLESYAEIFPIIIMTSFVEKSIASDAIKQGAVNYIAKRHQPWEQIPELIEQSLYEWNYIRNEKAYINLHDEVHLDLKWKIINFQGRISEKLGYSSKYENELFIDTFVHSEYRETLTAGLLRFTQGFDEYREIRLVSPEGYSKEIWVRILFSDICKEETSRQQIKLSFSNITELIKLRKKNFEQLENLENKANERTRIYKRAIIQLAHDTRTPISVIQSNLEILKDLTSEAPITKQNAEMKRVLKTLSDGTNLLDKNLAGLEQYISEKLKDEKKPNFRNIRIGNITNFLIGQFISQALINCEFEGLEEQHFFVIDEDMTKNILIELVTNAIKYSSPYKGAIEILIKIRQFEEKIFFSVIDNGRGIETENHDKIFEDFAQINNNTDTGLGLGLPLARHRANKMGGNLELLDSINNKGSTFCLSLPVRRDS